MDYHFDDGHHRGYLEDELAKRFLHLEDEARCESSDDSHCVWNHWNNVRQVSRMVDRCKVCGEPSARYPLKGNPNKSFLDNVNDGTVRWKNLFRMDVFSVLVLISVLLIIVGYNETTKACDEVLYNPSGFCDEWCEANSFNYVHPEGQAPEQYTLAVPVG